MTESIPYLAKPVRASKVSFARPSTSRDFFLGSGATREASFHISQEQQVTQPLVLPGSSLDFLQDYIRRPTSDVLEYVVRNIDDDERTWLLHDLHEAVDEAVNLASLAPIGEALRDWEATVEVNLDDALSLEVHQALEEYERDSSSIPL
jgi:hypothetical protein